MSTRSTEDSVTGQKEKLSMRFLFTVSFDPTDDATGRVTVLEKDVGIRLGGNFYHEDNYKPGCRFFWTGRHSIDYVPWLNLK